MKHRQRIIASVMASLCAAGALAFPSAALASAEGRRNTAMALGGAAVYLLLTQKNKVPGIIAAAGAVIAYKRYDDARRSYRDCNQGYGYYDNRDYQRNSDYQASSEYYANGYDSQWNRGQRWEGQEQHGMYSRDRNQHNDWENRGARAKDAHRGR